MAETDLYAPIKRFLESQGYAVKGEVGRCDVVAVRGDEPPVIVELKQSFSLKLILQGIDRQAMSDAVYLAIPAVSYKTGRDIHALCKRLGLGVITVHRGLAQAELDPAPYQPRQNKKRTALLLKEFAHRHGDPNCGGSTRTPLVTAYRQDALRCARLLASDGAVKVAEIRSKTQVTRAASIVRDDVYGWFFRHERGIYALTDKGKAALDTYAGVVAAL
ncbi:MAG: DUF2161 domain-containing phosphodiesterase [Beijerinckiaceae bacterium]